MVAEMAKELSTLAELGFARCVRLHLAKHDQAHLDDHVRRSQTFLLLGPAHAGRLATLWPFQQPAEQSELPSADHQFMHLFESSLL